MYVGNVLEKYICIIYIRIIYIFLIFNNGLLKYKYEIIV